MFNVGFLPSTSLIKWLKKNVFEYDMKLHVIAQIKNEVEEYDIKLKSEIHSLNTLGNCW